MYKVGDIIEGCHSSTKGIERKIVSVDTNSLDDKGNKVTSYWWCYPDVLDKEFWSGWGPDIELNIFWKLKVETK